MNDWVRHDISDLITKGQLIIGDGYRAKNEELSSYGLPFARAGNVKDGFRFFDADHFPEESLDRVGTKVSRPRDVVFTSKGTVGRFAFVRAETPRFVYSPQLCFWRAIDTDTIHPRFLYYWMYGREFFVQFKGVAGQTDMAEYVSLTDQRRMHITLPSGDLQREIASVLGVLDDQIDLNRRMNENLEATARALFKDWFVDFGPVRAKAQGLAAYLTLVSQAGIETLSSIREFRSLTRLLQRARCVTRTRSDPQSSLAVREHELRLRGGPPKLRRPQRRPDRSRRSRVHQAR